MNSDASANEFRYSVISSFYPPSVGWRKAIIRCAFVVDDDFAFKESIINFPQIANWQQANRACAGLAVGMGHQPPNPRLAPKFI